MHAQQKTAFITALHTSTTSFSIRDSHLSEGKTMRAVIYLFVPMTCASILISSIYAAPPEIVLWPNGMPAPVVPADPPEKVETRNEIQRRTNVSNPRLFVYEPPAGV